MCVFFRRNPKTSAFSIGIPFEKSSRPSQQLGTCWRALGQRLGMPIRGGKRICEMSAQEAHHIPLITGARCLQSGVCNSEGWDQRANIQRFFHNFSAGRLAGWTAGGRFEIIGRGVIGAPILGFGTYCAKFCSRWESRIWPLVWWHGHIGRNRLSESFLLSDSIRNA